MIPTGDDDQITVVHTIDQTVAFIDPPGPETGQVLPEGFGFAELDLSCLLHNYSFYPDSWQEAIFPAYLS
ncbi:hypothetical protein DPF_1321 [Desulfoplanes formicivorans]|uniref:Uncharacterized protein n=1 Tax=Desulfoplanes formicivorans TaxID=1592317 RepID=A0A194AEV9_9BACT|nr:hypothetical protein DPF_1321 [Desulfoplanes formicivorans]